jgi:HK97 family phage prohead protease
MNDLAHLLSPFEVKATNDAARTFSGQAAAWSLDLGGDVIASGAFKRTLADWRRSKGKIIPLCDSHRRDSVRAVVGKMTDAEETPEGLAATFALVSSPDGEEIFRRIKDGLIDGLSIGYEVVVARAPTAAELALGVERVLVEVKLKEISVCVFPMNESARIAPRTAKVDPATAYLAAFAGDRGASGGGLALDDPRRIRLEERVRDVRLAHLMSSN